MFVFRSSSATCLCSGQVPQHVCVQVKFRNMFVFRFSNMLAPIWDESADKLAAEMPDAKVVIAKVPHSA